MLRTVTFAFLVAAACIAILAVAGYFFWGEYTKGQMAERERKFALERSFCLRQLENYATRKLDDPRAEEMKALVEACLAKGSISASDINTDS